VDGMEVRSARLESLRRVVSLVGDNNEIFAGTLEENIVVGRPHVTHEDIRRALDIAQLTEDLATLPHGTKTMLVSGGRNISHGQAQRLLIARAIVDRPQLLILDEAFTGIDEKTKVSILDALYSPEHEWTLIDISHDAEVVMRSNTVHVLSHGRIVESRDPVALAERPGSEFASLFPDLTQQIRGGQGTPHGHGGAGLHSLELSEVPGIGPARRAALAEAGVSTVAQLAALTPSELAAIPGIGAQQAQKILAFLHRERSSRPYRRATAPSPVAALASHVEA